MASGWIFVVLIFPISAFAAEGEGVPGEQQADSVRRGGGRVIEYAEQSKKGNKVLSKPTPRNDPEPLAGNSVKLITGGDPTDGRPKESRLPVLD